MSFLPPGWRILGNGSLVKETDPTELLDFLPNTADENAPSYERGMFLRSGLRTYNLCRSEEGGAPFIYQRAATVCAGTHPDSGVIFHEVIDGQRVLVDGIVYEITSEWNDNLGLAEVPA